MSIAAIDFARLYKDHLAAAARVPKPAGAWDGRAAEMNQNCTRSAYVGEFIRRMELSDAHSLLDIGCGPGTISLALAKHFEQITALDYSQGMLETLQKNAHARQIHNITPVLLSWDDDWSAVPQADIVVASRSTLVNDLADALKKLNDKAKKRVYLTHPASGSFVPPALFSVLGRHQLPLPDFIYIINVLYQMGIQPRLDYIERERPSQNEDDFGDFARRVGWSLGTLNNEELQRLRQWYQAHPETRLNAGTMRWAFISWEKS